MSVALPKEMNACHVPSSPHPCRNYFLCTSLFSSLPFFRMKTKSIWNKVQRWRINRRPRDSIVATIRECNQCELLTLEIYFLESVWSLVGTETLGSVRCPYCSYYRDIPSVWSLFVSPLRYIPSSFQMDFAFFENKKWWTAVHHFFYSTVTDLAKLRGLSTSKPLPREV